MSEPTPSEGLAEDLYRGLHHVAAKGGVVGTGASTIVAWLELSGVTSFADPESVVVALAGSAVSWVFGHYHLNKS